MTKFQTNIRNYFKSSKPSKIQVRLTKYFKLKLKIYNCVDCDNYLGKNNFKKYCHECNKANRCTTCDINIGEQNPRVYCGKYKCDNIYRILCENNGDIIYY